jgi:predicted ArsR family transcriptional regulator
VLRDIGADVEVVRRGRGERGERGWRLQGYACPLSAVTPGHPEVCELARALVEEIAGVPVREACDRSGRPRCAFVGER